VKLLQTTRMPETIPPGQTLISAKGVSVNLGGNRILDAIDLVARAGELIALVGPNGAGKSTLLKVLSGDIAPVSGEVQVHGQPLDSWTDRELALRRAVLPQDMSVSFPFLVEDIVRMGRAPWTGSDASDSDDAVVMDAMRQTDTADLAARRFTTLSGGEKARVSFARILAQETQLLLLDEPTAALDIHHQELTLQVLQRHVREGGCAVVVLHDLALAAAHADRIAVISRGRIVADGPPAGVLTAELLTSVYHHDIKVVPHPDSGEPLVLPVRRHL
jgi:iron complex transport system ATP-binding protein